MKKFLTNAEKLSFAKKFIASDNIYDLTSKTFLYAIGKFKFDNAVYLMLRNEVPVETIETTILDLVNRRINTPVCHLTLSDREEEGFANSHFYPVGKTDIECKEKLTKLIKKHSHGGEFFFNTTGYLDRYYIVPNLTEKNNVRIGIYIRDSRIGWGAFCIFSSISINFRKRNYTFVSKSPVFRAYHNNEIGLSKVVNSLKDILSTRIDKDKIRKRFLRFINNDNKFKDITSLAFKKKQIELMMESEDKNEIILDTLLNSEEYDRVEKLREIIYTKVILK